MNSFPKYYDDVATRQESRPADAGDGGSVLLEYLGCFRDHPGNLREFYGPDGVSSPLGVSAMSRGQEQQLEEKDTVYAFPHSLTPHVRMGIRQTKLWAVRFFLVGEGAWIAWVSEKGLRVGCTHFFFDTLA